MKMKHDVLPGDEIRIPVITVNGDLWPINYEAYRRHMFFFNAIVLKEADHFLMIDRKEEKRNLKTILRLGMEHSF